MNEKNDKIYINQANIKWNAENLDQPERPIYKVRRGLMTYECKAVEHPDFKFVYQRDAPLPCGCTLWIEPIKRVAMVFPDAKDVA